MSKQRVYFNEFNVLMENSAYLPFVSGILASYALQNQAIKDHYEIAPFLFFRDTPDNILSQYDKPSVAAFSVLMWNEQLSLHIAKLVKEKYPDCLIVFGGASVPFEAFDYLTQHPFIDVAVRGEGEEAFSELLDRNRTTKDYSGIARLTWRDNAGKIHHNTEKPVFSKEMDHYPSPYLSGVYDQTLAKYKHLDFQAIIETNRGCPFKCSFCFWGKNVDGGKFRFHSLDRVFAELKWTAENKIKYVFNADSNFGMHRRDKEITEYLVSIKNEFGYPEKFRTCFGKNADDRIFDISTTMHTSMLDKGITLSRQSHSEDVLTKIKRGNIKISTFNNLQMRYNEIDVPVYSELILGLPGETYESWVNGIEEHLNNGITSQLFIYLCQVYPNTDLTDPDYVKEHEITTKRIKLAEIHSSPRKDGEIGEFEDIIIKTNTMSTDEWKLAVKFSWIAMLFYSMRTAIYALKYLNYRHNIPYTEFINYLLHTPSSYENGTIINSLIRLMDDSTSTMLGGNSRGVLLDNYSDIIWEVEEACFLKLTEQTDVFYKELSDCISLFLLQRKTNYNQEELQEVLAYQELRIPNQNQKTLKSMAFSYSIPEYFSRCFSQNTSQIERQDVVMFQSSFPLYNKKSDFSKEIVLWGRKSGKLQIPVEFKSTSISLDEEKKTASR